MTLEGIVNAFLKGVRGKSVGSREGVGGESVGYRSEGGSRQKEASRLKVKLNRVSA